MTDKISSERRSYNMARIKSEDTKPEIAVRSILHKMGYRFRLHRRDLPGSPDIVLPKYKAAIFVHGCFWHRHKGCDLAYMPKSNTQFWRRKFLENIQRDELAIYQLAKLGWSVIIVWECELKSPNALADRLDKELSR